MLGRILEQEDIQFNNDLVVMEMDRPSTLSRGMFWRYHEILLDRYDYVMVQDVDNILTNADWDVMEQFIQSGKTIGTFNIPSNDLPDLMNIGSSDEISIHDLANIVKEVVGYDGNIEWDRSKPNGTPRKVMDCSLFKWLTNWKPSTSLARGIERCHEDYLNNRNSLRQ